MFESEILAMFAAPHSQATQLVHIIIIVSNKVHIFSGCKDMNNNKPWAFLFFWKNFQFPRRCQKLVFISQFFGIV